MLDWMLGTHPRVEFTKAEVSVRLAVMLAQQVEGLVIWQPELEVQVLF